MIEAHFLRAVALAMHSHRSEISLSLDMMLVSHLYALDVDRLEVILRLSGYL